MNRLLYGHNADQHLIAVHQNGESQMRVYSRRDGQTVTEDVDFYPFFFLSNKAYLEGFAKKHWVKELEGNNHYKFLCAFTRWSDMWEAVNLALLRYNQSNEEKVQTYGEADFLFIRPDPSTQYLMQTGRTLFKGMKFEDLHRLQLDIETYSSRRYSRAERLEDRIVLIALADSGGWEYVIDGRKKSEREMLNELVDVIVAKDPDVIEGHNIFNFDLPYILQRCVLNGVEFGIGRDRTPLRGLSPFAERGSEFNTYEVNGRHIIDTWLLVQSYDIGKREMESYGLKYAARYFGLASPDRFYISGDKISWHWDNEPELLIRYALDDVRETRLLSQHLSPTAFYLAQMGPLSYGITARLGTAAKIEALLLREYLRQKHSVPRPMRSVQTTGGYTDLFYTGVLEPVVHVDVESLYPSIIIKEGICPKSDPLRVFVALIKELTKLRLATKRKMTKAADPAQRSKLDAMQSSLKILVNSFYGYLGYNRALFNDYEQADRVTKRGQEVLRNMIDEITTRGAQVVEVDTDGVYFVPPSDVRGVGKEIRFVKDLSQVMPEGIHLVLGGRFKKILSYKKKNYALSGYDGKVEVKGSSLVSRSMEPFARDYIHQCIESLLTDSIERLHELYVNLRKDLLEHKLDVRSFAKTETIRDPLEQYSREVEAGKRNRGASYEVALRSGRSFRPGDKISYYFTGTDPNIKAFESCKLVEEWIPNAPDENTAFYLRRLDEYTKRFEVFFNPQDFRKIFSAEDLFPFSPENIEILTQEVKKAEEELEEEEMAVEPKIWLAEEV
jgi:DNA polymerase I